MSDRRYTAQEMRETADCFEGSDRPYWFSAGAWNEVSIMLRQAADTEEELATLKGERKGLLKANESLDNDNDRLRGENEKLKARLDAVVKTAKEQFEIIFNSPMCWDEDENEFHSLEQLNEMDALEKVVATARGEGDVNRISPAVTGKPSQKNKKKRGKQ